MRRSWKNKTAELYLTLDCCNPEGRWQNEDGRSTPPALTKWLDDRCANADGVETVVELTVVVSSSGYYDSGSMYARNGDPGDPPEGDEERTVTRIEDADGLPLPKELTEEIEAWLSSDIKELEIEIRD